MTNRSVFVLPLPLEGSGRQPGSARRHLSRARAPAARDSWRGVATPRCGAPWIRGGDARALASQGTRFEGVGRAAALARRDHQVKLHPGAVGQGEWLRRREPNRERRQQRRRLCCMIYGSLACAWPRSIQPSRCIVPRRRANVGLFYLLAALAGGFPAPHHHYFILPHAAG